MEQCNHFMAFIVTGHTLHTLCSKVRVLGGSRGTVWALGWWPDHKEIKDTKQKHECYIDLMQ